MLKKMALSGIANLFAERMPFNKLIGMQVTHYDFDKVELRIKMEEKLIGNPFHNILHGGVTASLLDVAGGMIVAAPASTSWKTSPPAISRSASPASAPSTCGWTTCGRGAATSSSPPPTSSGPAARSPLPAWSCTTKKGLISPSVPAPTWWAEPARCIKTALLI